MNFFLDNWFQLVTTLGIAIGWIVDRQVRKSSAKQTEAEAMQGMQDVYDKFVSDVQNKINALTNEVDDLRYKLEKANLEREILLQKIADFEINAEKDKRLINELKRKVDRYEKELQQYKKSLK